MANLKAVLKHLMSKPKDYAYMMDIVGNHNQPTTKIMKHAVLKSTNKTEPIDMLEKLMRVAPPQVAALTGYN